MLNVLAQDQHASVCSASEVTTFWRYTNLFIIIVHYYRVHNTQYMYSLVSWTTDVRMRTCANQRCYSDVETAKISFDFSVDQKVSRTIL